MAIIDQMTTAQADRLLASADLSVSTEDRRATREALAAELGCSAGTIDRAISTLRKVRNQQPEAVTTLANSLPLLGYTVAWDLDGSEQISYSALSEALIVAGFADFDPGLPSEKANLQRAISAWVKDMRSASSKSDGSTKETSLIRKIDDQALQYTTWAVLLERADLAEMALDHQTTIRVSLEKTSKAEREAGKCSAMSVSASARGSVLQQQSEAMTQQLVQYWQRYQDTYTVGSLSGLLTTLVKAMRGSSLRSGGGMYVVPASEHEALARLQQFVQSLPGSNMLLLLPIVDDEAARVQLANGLYKSLVNELDVLANDMQRLEASKPRGARALEDRIAGFMAVKEKAQQFSSAMADRIADIDARVSELTAAARAMLDAPEQPEQPASEDASEDAPVLEEGQQLETTDPSVAAWHEEAQTPAAPVLENKPGKRSRIKKAQIA
jgi:hypothetical protein